MHVRLWHVRLWRGHGEFCYHCWMWWQNFKTLILSWASLCWQRKCESDGKLRAELLTRTLDIASCLVLLYSVLFSVRLNFYCIFWWSMNLYFFDAYAGICQYYESQPDKLASFFCERSERLGVWGRCCRRGLFFLPQLVFRVSRGVFCRVMYQLANGWRWVSIFCGPWYWG